MCLKSLKRELSTVGIGIGSEESKIFAVVTPLIVPPVMFPETSITNKLVSPAAFVLEEDTLKEMCQYSA